MASCSTPRGWCRAEMHCEPPPIAAAIRSLASRRRSQAQTVLVFDPLLAWAHSVDSHDTVAPQLGDDLREIALGDVALPIERWATACRNAGIFVHEAARERGLEPDAVLLRAARHTAGFRRVLRARRARTGARDRGAFAPSPPSAPRRLHRPSLCARRRGRAGALHGDGRRRRDGTSCVRGSDEARRDRP